jgi:hypothetical protein
LLLLAFFCLLAPECEIFAAELLIFFEQIADTHQRKVNRTVSRLVARSIGH